MGEYKHPKISREWLMEKYVEEAMSYREIGELVDLSHERIRQIASKYGLNKMKRFRKPPLLKKKDYALERPDIFNEINSEEKAYWIGFLKAKARVYKYGQDKKYRKIVVSANGDRKQLEKFRRLIGLKKGIRGYEYAKPHLVFYSDEFAEILIRHGIRDDTFQTVFPKEMNEMYYHHYIRGYFEYKNFLISPHIGKSVLRLEIRGKKEFLEGLVAYLNYIELNLSSKVSQKQKDSTYIFRSGSIDFISSFLQYIYDGSTYYSEEIKEKSFKAIEELAK